PLYIHRQRAKVSREGCPGAQWVYEIARPFCQAVNGACAPSQQPVSGPGPPVVASHAVDAAVFSASDSTLARFPPRAAQSACAASQVTGPENAANTSDQAVQVPATQS